MTSCAEGNRSTTNWAVKLNTEGNEENFQWSAVKQLHFNYFFISGFNADQIETEEKTPEMIFSLVSRELENSVPFPGTSIVQCMCTSRISFRPSSSLTLSIDVVDCLFVPYGLEKSSLSVSLLHPHPRLLLLWLDRTLRTMETIQIPRAKQSNVNGHACSVLATVLPPRLIWFFHSVTDSWGKLTKRPSAAIAINDTLFRDPHRFPAGCRY